MEDSDERRQQHGSTSPRQVSRRLFKILSNDPASDVTPSLGAKSTSHPNVQFSDGGGFTVRTRTTSQMTPEEIEMTHQEKLRKWKEHGSRGKAPQPPSGTKVTFEGDLEYHPPGGIHSNYNPILDEEIGGSYLRVKTAIPTHSESRYGRHGSFDSRNTFDQQPLNPKARRGAGLAQTQPVIDTRSPPPSPTTARKLTAKLYESPQELMSQLSTPRTYKQIANPLSHVTLDSHPDPVGISGLNPHLDPVYDPRKDTRPQRDFGPIGSGRGKK